MTDINFYDFDFNLLATFPRVISFNFEKKYCGFGTAELHFSINEKELIYMLERNPYLFFVAGENSAVVTGWKLDEDIAVFARTTEWLLTKRGAEPFVKENAAPEDIVAEAVLAAAGDFVEVGELFKSGRVKGYSIEDVLVLYDVIRNVLGPEGLGFSLEPDIKNKKFVFSVYSGNEVLCLFSPSARTAFDMTYVVEKQDMATNSGWYNCKLINMGDWDASANTPSLSNKRAENAFKYYRISKSYNSRFGLNCVAGQYLYCDTADGAWKVSAERTDRVWQYHNGQGETGAKKWDAVISGVKTETEALAQLSSMKAEKSISAETKSVEYGKEYRLGDIVNVQFEFGEFKNAEKKRISEVHIYCDVNESGIKPVFSSLEE